MSRNLDLLQAAYQRAGRDGVDAVVDLLDPQVEWIAAQPGPWDCHDREQVVETFRRKYDHGVRADFGEPVEVGDKVILDVRPYRRDEQGNKIDDQRLWQVLTMRDRKIVRIQDYTDQATALKRSGCPPARRGVCADTWPRSACLTYADLWVTLLRKDPLPPRPPLAQQCLVYGLG